MAARTTQDWLRWLDIGAGRRWITLAAILLGATLIVVTVPFKQFHGPRDETTLAQLALGRSLAEGRGFATPVLHPQAAAWLASQGGARVAGESSPRTLPDVYQPPGYPLAVGAALRLAPASFRTSLFGAAPPPPQGYAADYYLLAWNIAGLVVVALGTVWVGRRYFEPRVGAWAGWAVLVSVPAWAGVVALTGIPLSMGLALAAVAVALAAWRVEARGWAWALGAGAAAGALGLVDYPWLVAGPVIAAWLAIASAPGRRLKLSLVAGLAWAAVVTPWVVRNVDVTSLPLGLAGQDLFLRVGDSTAEPSVVRSLASAEFPRVDWNKANHKLALHLKAIATADFWAVGGVLAAWFVVSLAYRSTDDLARRGLSLVLALAVAAGVAEGWLDAGEGQRSVVVALWPVLALWGARFLSVWVESRSGWRERAGWVSAGFVLLQTLPLTHDLAEPSGIRFTYPPYYPALLQTLGREVERRPGWTWMSDVPAGAAWYSGGPVWAVPAEAGEFRRFASQAPVLALLLTPKTLDRPFYSELTKRDEATRYPFWQWPDVYAGLLTGHFPASFPLQRVEKYAPNLVVLLDAQAAR